MKILVASKNNAKIEGARRAFSKFYENIEIEGISVDSNVSEEPMNGEIYDGAKNRVKNLIKYAKENGISADYYVAIESGITNLFGNWEIISVAMTEDKNGVQSFSTSAGYPVPEKYVEDVLATNIGKVIADTFSTDSKSTTKGAIAVLTKDNVTRYDLNEQALLMCLTTYINGDKWK